MLRTHTLFFEKMSDYISGRGTTPRENLFAQVWITLDLYHRDFMKWVLEEKRDKIIELELC